MRIKPGFKLRTVMGKSVVIAEGANQVDFNKLIYLNDSAARIWKEMEGHDFTDKDMAAVLITTYDVDPEEALADARELASQWLSNGLVD